MRVAPSLLVILVSWSAISTARGESEFEPAAVSLFSGTDLQGWECFAPDATTKAEELWTVQNGTLRCTAAGKGYLRTRRAYADYKLTLEWRWPHEPGNSGVMVHLVGDDMLWPKSFEAQLKAGAAGDFGSFVDARSNEEIVSRNPKGVSTGRLSRPGPAAENPVGQWNSYEILAQGDTITLRVNGHEVNRMTGVVPSGGMIGLQAEGTVIEFRNITLTPLPPAKDLHAPMPQ